MKTAKYRLDGTRILSTSKGDNPKLGAKLLSDGTESLFLDFYYGCHEEYSERAGRIVVKKERRRETLHLQLFTAPSTPAQRQHNRDTLAIAQQLRIDAAKQLLRQERGYNIPQQEKPTSDLLAYFAGVADAKRAAGCKGGNYKSALARFRRFLADSPAYKQFATHLRPAQLTPDMVTAFTAYLRDTCKGNGAAVCFSFFKTLVNAALEAGVLKTNPCKGISMRVDKEHLSKDILTPVEIEQMMRTPLPSHMLTTRRAFLFSLFTGLRFCDVTAITWGNVDLAARRLSFQQQKTAGHSSNSYVETPLSDTLIKIIGTPQSKATRIFDLPCKHTCLRYLAKWTRAAGIDKHITWHCARHSFAVNLLNNGANIKVVSNLMGHSSILMTEKYLRAVDALKVDAIERQQINTDLL